MAPDEEELGSAAVEEITADETTSGEGKEKPKLELEVKIDSRSACERHVTVTIPRNEVDRYLDLAYSDMMDKAVVPGF
ncbi:MAG: hypothetical protein B7Z73_17815, partial [Planctomycetia bacterium 21-64-5]